MGCSVHIDIREYKLYPDYALSIANAYLLTNKKLRHLYEAKFTALKQALVKGKHVEVATLSGTNIVDVSGASPVVELVLKDGSPEPPGSQVCVFKRTSL